MEDILVPPVWGPLGPVVWTNAYRHLDLPQLHFLVVGAIGKGKTIVGKDGHFDGYAVNFVLQHEDKTGLRMAAYLHQIWLILIEQSLQSFSQWLSFGGCYMRNPTSSSKN